jgi:hypothetical protein
MLCDDRAIILRKGGHFSGEVEGQDSVVNLVARSYKPGLSGCNKNFHSIDGSVIAGYKIKILAA